VQVDVTDGRRTITQLRTELKRDPAAWPDGDGYANAGQISGGCIVAGGTVRGRTLRWSRRWSIGLTLNRRRC